jgi:hypothetical protein
MRAVRCWSFSVGAALTSMALCIALADPLPPSATYRPLPTLPLSAVKANDEAEKPQVMQDQQALLNQRYDLSNNGILSVWASELGFLFSSGIRSTITLPVPHKTWVSGPVPRAFCMLATKTDQ